MSNKDPAQLRIELARGHWSLGEHDDAVACLERAVEDAEDHNPLMVLVGTWLDDTSAGPVVDRLIALRDGILARMEKQGGFDLPEPMATPTMAQLLADQGHPDRARAVAEDLLRRNPDDPRARALHEALLAREKTSPADARARTIARLERLLGAARRRTQGEAQA